MPVWIVEALVCQRYITTNFISSLIAESLDNIEEFFLDTAAQYIRRYFPPSFAFTEFDINDKGR